MTQKFKLGVLKEMLVKSNDMPEASRKPIWVDVIRQLDEIINEMNAFENYLRQVEQNSTRTTGSEVL